VLDGALDAVTLVAGQRRRLQTASLAVPRRSVLALAVEREDAPNVLAAARAELERSRHRVRFVSGPVAGAGKFENLNKLLAQHPAAGHDWLVVVDDDVSLPPGFLDEFLFLAERFDLRLAQPAHREGSHAAWDVTRRRALSVVRETAFVEIGPVTAFHSSTFEALLPFPELRYGWGLDAHWSAIAREHGWRLGVVDATAVQHGLRQVAAAYDRGAAIDEAREFLRDRPYVRASEARRTLVTHRNW
jgi:hypothetical protein